jgi:hypothetical protein
MTAYQQALRLWVLANEHACTLGHGLALAELAQAGPADQERARAFLAEMLELLRAAKGLAASIG